jgi:hypothetical protein
MKQKIAFFAPRVGGILFLTAALSLVLFFVLKILFFAVTVGVVLLAVRWISNVIRPSHPHDRFDAFDSYEEIGSWEDKSPITPVGVAAKKFIVPVS